jgi:hypothetical protein
MTEENPFSKYQSVIATIGPSRALLREVDHSFFHELFRAEKKL